MAVEDAISFWTDIQRYENMLAADPRSYCFVPLSELYRKLGLLDDAISVALKGCGLHPDYPGGFFALGSAYQAKGASAEARQALETVVALKPDHILALKLLGKVYIEEGSTDLAARVLEQVLELDPQDAEITLLLRSIGAAPVAAPAPAAAGGEPEEEILEEVDLVEELTEEMETDFPEAASPEIEGMAGVEPVSVAAPRRGEGTDLWGGAFEGDDFSAFEDVDEPVAAAPASFAPAGGRGDRLPGGRDPLATATMAELYVSQGFLDKAIAIYRDLLNVEPANHSYRQRVEELGRLREQQAQPLAAPQPAQQPARPTPQEAPAPSATQGAPVQPVVREPSTTPEPPAQQAVPAAAAQQVPQAPPAAPAQAAQLSAGHARVHLAQEPELSASTPAGPLDPETELTRWLHNIRRRRDGV